MKKTEASDQFGILLNALAESNYGNPFFERELSIDHKKLLNHLYREEAKY